MIRPILALDLGTATGWAALRPDGQVVSGAHNVAPKGCEIGRFAALFGRWLTETVIANVPEVVVFEAPFAGGHTSQATARKNIGLAVLTELIAYKRDLDCYERTYSSVVKHFTGFGGGKRADLKARVMAMCLARGWKPETQDEADARAILDDARHCLGETTAAPGALFREAG